MPRTLNDAFGLTLVQREVDFVLPRLDGDLPLCIDPFLLYKSRQPELRTAHGQLLEIFRQVFAAFEAKDRARAVALVDFPEANEIRLGYAKVGNTGRGMGNTLGRLVLETLESSPALVRRGLKHVEELQLFSVGIGPDRISDLAGNVLKDFLISYTKRQSALWSIPITTAVPLSHIWQIDDGEWVDRYDDVPTDPLTGRPILLVPRWIVRRLPWINYGDYEASTLRAHLGPRSVRARGGVRKPAGVALSRQDVTLVDRYVLTKERNAASARPTGSTGVAPIEAVSAAAPLLSELRALAPGGADAYRFQRLILRAINELFEPDLVDGREQVRTEAGVEIRDVVFSNDSDLPFLRYLANNHGSHVIVFECKNKLKLDANDVNQLANYLGDPMGYAGFLVSRAAAADSIMRKCIATYVKSTPHRIILVFSDADLGAMYAARAAGRSPADVLRRKYRDLMEAVD
jgi:hypothetical protein